MSIYTYNITSAVGDEQLIVGKGDQVTRISLITVYKEDLEDGEQVINMAG